MRRKFLLIGILSVLIVGTSVGFIIIRDSDTFFEVRRSIDLFGAVYKDVIDSYVYQFLPDNL